jgi:hypothetical protein
MGMRLVRMARVRRAICWGRIKDVWLIVKGEPLGERFGGVGLLFSFGTIGKRTSNRRRGFVQAGMIVSVERVVVEGGKRSSFGRCPHLKIEIWGTRRPGGF